MAETEAERVALFLDKLGGDLADSLHWALDLLDSAPSLLAGSVRHAERYAEARRHLNVRRGFEASCRKATER